MQMQSPILKRSLAKWLGRYHEQMNAKGRSYLNGRGITDKAINDYQLGVVEKPGPGHEPYVGMLSIPYLTPSGPAGVKFRFLDEDRSPKYLVPAGQTPHLYNVNAFHRAVDTIAICEGELDALIMESVVGVPAVGVAGVNMWKPHFPRCFEGFERIFIMADNDVKENGTNPGRLMANRIVEDLRWARIIHLPPGEDVNSLVLKGGPEKILQLLDPPDDDESEDIPDF